jgi:hypothetical protein
VANQIAALTYQSQFTVLMAATTRQRNKKQFATIAADHVTISVMNIFLVVTYYLSS